MRLKISGLARAEYQYEFTEDAASLGLDKDYFAPVQSSIRLMKNNNQIFIECNSRTEKSAICDRCLIDFNLKIDGSFKVLYSCDSSVQDAEFEDIRYLHPDEDMIDLGEDIRQIILLNTPMKLLCNEECRGICPHCGKDLNKESCNCSVVFMNPKFSELKKLKFN